MTVSDICDIMTQRGSDPYQQFVALNAKVGAKHIAATAILKLEPFMYKAST